MAIYTRVSLEGVWLIFDQTLSAANLSVERIDGDLIPVKTPSQCAALVMSGVLVFLSGGLERELGGPVGDVMEGKAKSLRLEQGAAIDKSAHHPRPGGAVRVGIAAGNVGGAAC